MKRFVLFVTLSLVLMIAGSALADSNSRLHMTLGNVGTEHGGAINAGKALGDTVYMLGNPRDPDQVGNAGIVPVNGTFEDQFGNPGWYGWTTQDLTFSSELYWQVSDFNVVSGAFSMWCGSLFDGGTNPGYGNDWNQLLVYTYQVPNNTVANTVNWVITVQNDTEPGYDYTFLEWNQGGIWQNVGQFDGDRTFNENLTFTYNPEDYVGSGADEIQLRVRFTSDGAWSDEDGLWETDGACQIDDISVTVGGNLVESEDFEDGISQNWIPTSALGVGDYAQLYLNLQDIDPCRTNLSAQVAFVDDGVVVPGTGGSPCTTWCYGPNGWIVNNTGGPAGPDFYINNIIISPALEWPAGADAAYIEFGVYRHEELGAFGTWPGMFYQWHVRSVNTGDPADLSGAVWDNRNFVQYGGPDYLNQNEIVTDLLANGRTHVQLGLRVIEYGYVWGWVGTDGTPAPYFDNAKFVAYPFAGPGISTRSIDIFNDNFPESGDLDLINLANNNVRLDMANNIAQQDDLVNYPGDSIFFDIAAVRAGSSLNDRPKLFLKMKANPLFDGVRVLPANFTQMGNIIEGWVYGDTTFTQTDPPTVVDDRWNFDLPDDDFFFPGDVFNYYIEAQDNLMGNIGTTLLPADTSGFGNVEANLDYPVDFTVRALPTLNSTTPGDQPSVLFWQDAVDRGGQNEWFFALSQLGYKMGVDYDMYSTNGPSSGVGNGLGGRATSAQLSGYGTLLYTSSYLAVNLLANGDFGNDPSNDLQVVSNWFAQGDELNPKNAFMTGDEIVTGLLDAGAQGSAFVNSYFNVNYIDKDVAALIGNQTAPKVASIAGNGIIARVDEWIAFGGCLLINTFDALEVNAGATRLAEFTDPSGNTGVYNYAAASYYQNPTEFARVVMMPYDFMYLYNAPGWTPPAGYAGIPARAIILEDILSVFGESGTTAPVGVTPDAVMSVSNYPNPFNPKTNIQLTLPRAGEVSLKVFNVRGELVRTLVNGAMDQGVHTIEWDGKSDQGSQVASGVYFYETRANGEVKVNKMALVK